jgi:hypothetical protein
MPSAETEWITIAEAAAISGFEPDYLRKLIRAGRVEGRKYVIVWQVSRPSLLAYLREQRSKGERRGRKKRP